MRQGFLRRSLIGILLAGAVAGCTIISSGVITRFSLLCAFGDCGCPRIVGHLLVKSPLNNASANKDLTPGYATPGGLALQKLSDPILSFGMMNIDNRTLPLVMFFNRYGEYITRQVNGQTKLVNNFFGMDLRTSIITPPGVGVWTPYENVPFRLAVIKPSGGVRVEIQRPGEGVQTVIDSPEGTVTFPGSGPSPVPETFDALTLVCTDDSVPTHEIRPIPTDRTLIRYLFNISSRNEIEATTIGSYGGVEMLLYWGPNPSICGKEVIKDLAAVAPGTGYLDPRPLGTFVTRADVFAAGMFPIPDFAHQAQPADATQYGLRNCDLGE